MPHPHGTINRYNNQRCRCDLCRAAIRDYRRRQRAKPRSNIVGRDELSRAPIPAVTGTERQPDVRGHVHYWLARGSCGHYLWLAHTTHVRPGGLVGCPEHGVTSVREVQRAANVTGDALPGRDYRY